MISAERRCKRLKQTKKTNQRNYMSIPTEETEQAILFRWAEWKHSVFPELNLMYAIPNGGFRHLKTAVILKRTGTKSGVPDICLPVPRGGYHGMYIEMKRQKNGVVSKTQSRWIDELTKQGYYCVVCRGWEIASREIEKYLSQKLSQ